MGKSLEMTLISGFASTSSRVRVLLSGQDGIALLMVLVVITILTTLVVSFTDTTQKHLRVTQYYKNRLKAYWAAQSGLQAAAGLLRMDPFAAEPAGANSLWNCESVQYQELVTPILANVFCESSVIEGALLLTDTNSAGTETTLIRCPAAVPIVDENRKLSLAGLITNNKTDREAAFNRLSSLLQILLNEEDLAPAGEQQDASIFGFDQETKISEGKADELAGYLVDWMDTQDNASDPIYNPDSAEESCPVDGLPYEAKNGRLDSIDEIALVCGFRQMTRPTIDRLTRHLTAYDLVTNINTATIPVLNAFCSQIEGTLNETYGQEIYELLHPTADEESIEIVKGKTGENSYRTILGATSASVDLIDGLANSTGVRSDYFRIGIYGAVFDTETGTVTARTRLQMDLFRKQEKQLELLYYRED
jgi:Tfp pilus assembly protein PilX